MQAVWSGSIAFGLVNIPVKIYSAVESTTLGFRLLHDKCKTPLDYKRWCPKHRKEVSWEHVIKGLEIRKGEYYVFEKKEIEKLKPKRTETIEIVEFVDAQQIDPIYFDNHYFVAPVSSKEKAYYLLKEVLRSSAKVAIGRFVMRDKEYVCSIESYKKGMLLSTLNYAYEIRDINKIRELGIGVKLRPEEIKLAKKIIDKLYEEEWDITKFKDTFAQELKRMLKKKSKGKAVEVEEEKTVKKVSERTLMKALEESIKSK